MHLMISLLLSLSVQHLCDIIIQVRKYFKANTFFGNDNILANWHKITNIHFITIKLSLS